MKYALVTGGSGFFGGILQRRLIEEGWSVVNIDLVADEYRHERHTAVQGDLRDKGLVKKVMDEYSFDCVFHCAAIFSYAVKDKQYLWDCNVTGAQNLVDEMEAHGVQQMVFTSTCCLWAENLHRPVKEEDIPNPVESYGKSKVACEKILLDHQDSIHSVIIRCPTIVEAGRLGLLTILFEFIDEGRKVWTVGGGHNVYQFVYAMDLVDACLKAAEYPHTEVFGIGSDNVKPFCDVYKYVIDRAGTRARVASLPKKLSIFVMKLAHALNLSPLGPYQYKMIAEDFEFDTARIKEKLGWKPTMSNEEMLYRAYQYYHENQKTIRERKDGPAHKQSAKMGVIRLLKWIS